MTRQSANITALTFFSSGQTAIARAVTVDEVRSMLLRSQASLNHYVRRSAWNSRAATLGCSRPAITHF